jgi:hypothetical protein
MANQTVMQLVVDEKLRKYIFFTLDRS